MNRSVPTLAVLLLFWGIFFFSQWYSLTYTKIWELKQMVFRGKEAQLSVMHPPQMDRLLALRQSVQLSGTTTAFLVPDDPAALSLAGSGSMLRAVLYPYPVLLPAKVDERFGQAIKIIPCAGQDCSCERPTELPPSVRFACWEVRP